MTYHNNELDDLLEEKLKLIEPTTPRDPEIVRHRRDEFIKEVRYLRFGKPLFAIAGLLNRKPWQTLFSQPPALVPFAAAILLIFGLVFGSAGTVYAAQDSLPNDLLYPIKLTGENLRLAFTSDAQARISLLTTYTGRRVEEATTLVVLGQPVPEALPDQVDEYLEEVFILAASLDEASTQEALKGIQIHLRDQDQDMTNAMNGLPEGLDPELDQLRQMMKARQQIVQMGEGVPLTLQHRFRYQTITDTITSSLTGTLTTTLEISATRAITPGLHGPGPCEVSGACEPPGYGADEEKPPPFKGTPPVPDDEYGYGPGPLDSPESPMSGEQQQTPPPSINKSKGKDGGASKKGK